MEPFLGEIRLFASGEIPDGWLPCDGRSLPIDRNQALFSLIGFEYGGDKKANFNLPDLRGAVPIQYGGTHADDEWVELKLGESTKSTGDAVRTVVVAYAIAVGNFYYPTRE